jgi:tetratricopeptide (TPR) repeat protein
MQKIISSILFASAALIANTHGQVFPLSENTWSNPDFRMRFLGSYGFDTGVTPSITSEERDLFAAISNVIAQDPAAAIRTIEAALRDDSSAALFYTIGNLYFQSGNQPSAIDMYEKAIQRFPSFLRAYRNLGTLKVQAGDYDTARKMLIKAVELGAQGADVYGLLGFCYLNLGNASAALTAYSQALFFNPDSRDWRMGIVQALSNLGRHDEVIDRIDGLMQDFPEQVELLLMQANAFLAKGQPADAAATLEVMRSRGASTVASLSLLGDIYLNFQQPDLALSAYEQAISTEILSIDRILRIARRLANSGAWSAVDEFMALAEKQGLQNLSPDGRSEVLNLLAQSDLAQERADAASVKLEQVVAANPMNGQALLLLADYHWKKGDFERAEIYFERSARVRETAPDALVQHARMLVSQREFRKASALLERAQTLQPRSHVGQYLEQVAAAARTIGR